MAKLTEELRAKRNEQRRQWGLSNQQRIKEYQRIYRKAHRAELTAQQKEWKERNPDRWKNLRRKHYQENVAAHNARSASQRATTRKAIPSWANRFFIREIYDLARLRSKHLGTQYEVDHIIPLKSPFVCGLHCESNLRIIPAAENNKKGNRVWPGK